MHVGSNEIRYVHFCSKVYTTHCRTPTHDSGVIERVGLQGSMAYNTLQTTVEIMVCEAPLESLYA